MIASLRGSSITTVPTTLIASMRAFEPEIRWATDAAGRWTHDPDTDAQCECRRGR
jgi:hypothetical protein